MKIVSITVTASGTQNRMVVGVLINAAANDMGLLEQALTQARHMLHTVGLPLVVRLQAAADAGYWSQQDLAFAATHTGRVDMLINEKASSSKLGKKYFRREAFQPRSQEEVLCPADKRMLGPSYEKARGVHVYRGDDCEHCPLHASCTPSKQRKLVVNWEYEKLQTAMRERMSQEGAQTRYHQRMATAELLLKLLAHNVSRLLTRGKLLCVFFLLQLRPAPKTTYQPAALFRPTLLVGTGPSFLTGRGSSRLPARPTSAEHGLGRQGPGPES